MSRSHVIDPPTADNRLCRRLERLRSRDGIAQDRARSSRTQLAQDGKDRGRAIRGAIVSRAIPGKPTACAPQLPKAKGSTVVRLDPNPTPKLKAIGGGLDDRWNNRIAGRLVSALPDAHSVKDAEAASATLSGLVNINPADPVEGMLGAQIIAAHETALSLRRRAWHPEQSFVVQTRFLELADKAARTLAVLIETLDRHRGKGQQTVTVKYVTVNADQAMVADQIIMRRGSEGGGSEAK
jgi:hypothetical protein